MLRQFEICEGRLVEGGNGNAQVLVYVGPDDTERKHLVEDLKLDDHTLSSSLDPDELSRLEFEPEHAAIIFRRPKNYSSEDQFLFKVVSTGLFLFKDRLVIVLADDSPIFEGRAFSRICSVQEVVLKVIYRAIFHFEEHLKVINMLSNSLEQEINKAMENRHLLNLFTLEKSLVYYLSAIGSNATVIDRLRNSSTKIGLTPENLEMIEDLIIENNQCYAQAQVYSNILASLMDARVSIVSNNLNVLMKHLTLVMIAIMLPTMVMAAFSMNVEFPGRLNPWMFWMILGMSILSALLMGLVYNKYRKR